MDSEMDSSQQETDMMDEQETTTDRMEEEGEEHQSDDEFDESAGYGETNEGETEETDAVDTLEDDADEDDEEEEEEEEDYEEDDGFEDGEQEEGNEDEEDYDEEDNDDDDDGEDDGEDDEDDDDGDDDEEDWETLDADAEKCPVCLDVFSDKDVGTPESCDHVFCLECILEWSRNVNTCPVDRGVFRSILVRHSFHGDVVRRIEVDERNREDELDEETATYCEVCGRCDREDRLLLCDGCDAGYHCECLDPPLEHIPVEEWYCPECVAQNRHQEVESTDGEEEIVEPRLTREHHPVRVDRPSRSDRPVRAIARTHVSERVRARITLARAERQHEQPSTSGSVVSRPRSSTTVRKKKVKRKTTKKRKTKSRKTRRKKTKRTTTTTTASGKTVIKKRKVKRRKKRKVARRVTKSAIPKTVRGRIAGKLQLVKPRTGSMMPDVKIKGHHGLGYQRHEIGAATLLITAGDNLLDHSEESTSIIPKAPTSTASCRPQFVSSTSTSDLLGSIFTGQDMLHMSSTDVTINRDGSLSKIQKAEEQAKTANQKRRPSDPSEGSMKGSCSQSRSSISSPDKTTNEINSSQRHTDSKKNPIKFRDEDEKGEERETTWKTETTGRRNKSKEDESISQEKRKETTSQHLQDTNNEMKDEDDESSLHHHGDDDDDDDEDNDGDYEGLENVSEEEEDDPLSEEVSRKHDGSITCQASSSSFEESEEEVEGAIDEKLSLSRRSGGKEEHEEEEGLISDEQDQMATSKRDFSSKQNLEKKVLNSNKHKAESWRSRRKSSLEEGVIIEDGDRKKSRGRQLVSEEEGLIEDEQDYKTHPEKNRLLSHSDEEGLISDDEDKMKTSKEDEVKKEVSVGTGGNSSAEEGEVKSDDDEGSSSNRKKRKRERKRQKNRKDTRTVVIDSEVSLTVPKRPLAEKIKVEGRIPDPTASREFERDDGRPGGEHGVFGDLRHVIQVKRDVPHKRPSRYEAYWTELKRHREMEDDLAEKGIAWDHHDVYSQPFPYEEEWVRIVPEPPPPPPLPDHHWENFTIHRERSPNVDRRKDKVNIELRTEAERRIEMRQSLEPERRFEGDRRIEQETKIDSQFRMVDRKGDARRDHDRVNKIDPRGERASSRKMESDKSRNDRKKDSDPLKQRNDKESKQNSLHKGNCERGHKTEGHERRKHGDSKKESNQKTSGHTDKDKRHSKRQDTVEKPKDHNVSEVSKHRETHKSDSRSKHIEQSKSSRNGKDREKNKHEPQIKIIDREVSRDKLRKDSSKVKDSIKSHGKERSRSHDRSHGTERTVSHRQERSGVDSRHQTQRHNSHESISQSHERSSSRGHEQASKNTSDYSKHSQDPQGLHENIDKHKRGQNHSKDKIQVSSSSRKDKSKNKDTEKKKKDPPQATSTSDQPSSIPSKSGKIFRRARSPSTSQTNDTADEFDTSHQIASAPQLPITVPATEMVIDKPPVEKVKKKKKDKAKKVKNKDAVKGKKGKKGKGTKAKKQKVVIEDIAETEKNLAEEEIEKENNEELTEEPEQVEHPEQAAGMEDVQDNSENKRPATSPVSEEPAKRSRIEEMPENEENKEENMEESKETIEDPRQEDEEEKKEVHSDSSSDVEMVGDLIRNMYDEIIDLSQISSDEESFAQSAPQKRGGKDNSLYDPFDPTASPETITSPDISEKNFSQKVSKRSRERSHSPHRRSNRSPVPRRSSPKRRVSPRRQRSVSPRRKSLLRQKETSKEHGYSSRRRSTSPRRSAQRRRSPSPKRNVTVRKSVHSPRKSPLRSQRRQQVSPKRRASPKRHFTERKQSVSPRRQNLPSKRRRVESPRRRSPSPRRRKSPQRSESPRKRHVSPRRRSRSPRQHRVSPRRPSPAPRAVSPRRTRRTPSPRRQDFSSRRRSVSPKKQIKSSKMPSVSPRKKNVTPQRRDVSPQRHHISPRRRTLSPRRRSTSSSSSRSSSSDSRSNSRSRGSSSSWTSSSDSWSSSSYSRSPSVSSRSTSRSNHSPRRRHYSSRDRSSSSGRSKSSQSRSSSAMSSSPERTMSPQRKSPSPTRSHEVLRRSPTQTSSPYRHRYDSESASPMQSRQQLPDSTQGSFKVILTSPRSPIQVLAPATSTTDQLSSSASSQISHILGQLASNPAIQSAINSANRATQNQDETTSSPGSVSGFLKSSEASFTSPSNREVGTRREIEDKGLISLSDVNEDNIESSAVDLYNKSSRDRYLKKLQHQERVVEEVKLALKPYYQKRDIDKEGYKEILRKSVNQVCHSKSGEINPVKIKKLIEGYIKKVQAQKGGGGDDKKDKRPDLAFRLLTKS